MIAVAHLIKYRRIILSMLCILCNSLHAQHHSSASINTIEPNETTELLRIIDSAPLTQISPTLSDEQKELLNWKNPTVLALTATLLIAASFYFPSKCDPHPICTYLQAAARAALPAELVVVFSASLLACIAFFQRFIHCCTSKNTAITPQPRLLLPPPPPI